MNELRENKVVAALMGVPTFCIGRVYSKLEDRMKGLISVQYIFKFENGFGASVVDFKDKNFSGGKDFEMAMLKLNSSSVGYTLKYDTNIAPDVERGDEEYMEQLLQKIEKL